jgi:hypothetical protein
LEHTRVRWYRQEPLRIADVATDLATQLLGTGWLTGGMGWDDQAGKSNLIKPQRHSEDVSGRWQRFTKPLLAGADAAWSCERKARVGRNPKLAC